MKKTILTSYIGALKYIIANHPQDNKVVIIAGSLIAELDNAQSPVKAKEILEKYLIHSSHSPFTDLNKWHEEINKLIAFSDAAKNTAANFLSPMQLQGQPRALQNLLISTINNSECPLHTRYRSLMRFFPPSHQTLTLENIVTYLSQRFFLANNSHQLPLNDILLYISQLPAAELPEQPQNGSYAAIDFLNEDHKQVTQLLYNVTAASNEGCRKWQLANGLLQDLLEIYKDLNTHPVVEKEEALKAAIRC